MDFSYLGISQSYFEFLITFTFTFAIVLGILSASKVFGELKYGYVRNINILAALSLALFASLYEPYVKFVELWFPYLLGFFIFIFIAVMLKNLFSGEGKRKEKEMSWELGISLVLLFLVFLTLYSSLSYYKDISLLLGIAFVVLILVIGSKLKFPSANSSENENKGRHI